MNESKIVGLLRTASYFRRFGFQIDESFFTLAEAGKLFTYVKEYFDKYPDKDFISLKNLRLLVKEKGEERKLILKLIPKLKVKGYDEQVIIEDLKRFIQDGIIRSSLMDNLAAIEGRCDFDIDGLRKALDKAEELDISEDIYNYGEETISFHYDEARIAGEPIKTGVARLDDILPWAPTRKEMWVILAPPGRGKTQWMLNMLANAAMAGHTGLYITCGDQGRIDVQLRIDTIVSEIPYWRLIGPTNNAMGLLAKRIKARMLKKGGNIFIKDWSDTSATPGQVENLVRSMNPMPDIVAVDYPDIMRPGRALRYSEKRHEIGGIFAELRRIARRNDFLLWSGSQANRDAINRKNVSLENLAEDITKAWTADGIIGYCQTPEEKEEGMGRAFLAKARRPGIKLYVAEFSVDYDTGRIV